MGHERDQHLRPGRGNADEEAGDQQRHGRIRQRHGDQPERGEQNRRQHEQLALDEIGQRHEEEQSGAVADLGRAHDDPGEIGRDPDLGADRGEQRLRVIEIGDESSRRDRDHDDERRRQSGSVRRGGGLAGGGLACGRGHGWLGRSEGAPPGIGAPLMCSACGDAARSAGAVLLCTHDASQGCVASCVLRKAAAEGSLRPRRARACRPCVARDCQPWPDAPKRDRRIERAAPKPGWSGI